ncbi:hypothetical protein PFISCL1PPCAC_27857, partial [Pristionchus fissidentatus]
KNNSGTSYDLIRFHPYYLRITGVVSFLTNEEKQQTVGIVLKALVTWFDGRLAWDVSEFDGIDRVIMTRESVWRPAIVPSTFMNLNRDLRIYFAFQLLHTGRVLDTVTWSYDTVANMAFHEFPFDEHTINISFTSPVCHLLNVKLDASSGEICETEVLKIFF